METWAKLSKQALQDCWQGVPENGFERFFDTYVHMTQERFETVSQGENYLKLFETIWNCLKLFETIPSLIDITYNKPPERFKTVLGTSCSGIIFESC